MFPHPSVAGSHLPRLSADFGIGYSLPHRFLCHYNARAC